MKPTMSEIQEILKVFLDSELQELRLEIGDVRVAVSRNGAAPLAMSAQPAPASPAVPSVPSGAPASASAPAAASAPSAARPEAEGVQVKENWVAVTAASLGVFYRRPSPDQPPFVEVGAVVKQNDAVCLIEVMKMYNRVSAPCQGKIAAILVEDGKMVEYGQTLMYIDPA